MPPPSSNPPTHEPSNPPSIGWGILGCGRVAEQRVAPVFERIPGAYLAAVCSRSAGHARHFAGRFGADVRPYSDLDAFLADEKVSVVYIATPNALHAEQAQRCMAAGKHVLVDKPMATCVADAEAMIAAAEASNRLLGVMHQQRFHPANMHLLRLKDDGVLGMLNLVRIHVGMWYPPVKNWRLDPALAGGGVAMDLGPHGLDILLELMGEPLQVSAYTANLQFSYPVEDFCCARIEFAGGAVGLVEFSYCTHEYGGRLEAYGSEGTYVAHGSMQQAALYQTWLRRGRKEEPAQEDTYADCFVNAVEDFTDAVAHEGEPAVSMDDGLRTLRVLEDIYASARKSKVE